MEPVTEGTYEEWVNHPVTRKVMKMLYDDRETMKEGLVNDTFDYPEEVKGRCRAIAILLDLQYSDLFQSEPKERNYDVE